MTMTATLGANGWETTQQAPDYDTTPNKGLRVYEDAPAGFFSQFGRIGGGPLVKHTAVLNADAAVVSGACILYGIKVVTAGTSITVYDNTAASGTAVITGEATTSAGAMIYPAGPGVGVLMNTGIYLDLTLGTYIVYYVDAA